MFAFLAFFFFPFLFIGLQNVLTAVFCTCPSWRDRCWLVWLDRWVPPAGGQPQPPESDRWTTAGELNATPWMAAPLWIWCFAPWVAKRWIAENMWKEKKKNSKWPSFLFFLPLRWRRRRSRLCWAPCLPRPYRRDTPTTTGSVDRWVDRFSVTMQRTGPKAF